MSLLDRRDIRADLNISVGKQFNQEEATVMSIAALAILIIGYHTPVTFIPEPTIDKSMIVTRDNAKRIDVPALLSFPDRDSASETSALAQLPEKKFVSTLAQVPEAKQSLYKNRGMPVARSGTY